MTHPDKDNKEAERAPGITDAEIAGIMGWRGPGAYTEATFRKIKRIIAEDRARRAPPALDAEGLPDLPQPMRKVYERPHGVQELLYYTAEQVRQAQRDAYEAGKLAAITAAQRKVAEDLASMKARLARQGQQSARTSVDTAAFRIVLMLYNEGEITERQLIAHINAWGGVTEDHTKPEK